MKYMIATPGLPYDFDGYPKVEPTERLTDRIRVLAGMTMEKPILVSDTVCETQLSQDTFVRHLP